MNKNPVKTLESLYQLDVDAIHAYNQAIDKIENIELRDRLTEYRDDHEAHLGKLEGLITQRGGDIPSRDKDLKGHLIEGMTSLRSSMGDEQAMKAMRQNEVITNKKYKAAVEELRNEPEILEVLNRNYADEQKHLSFIEQALSHFERYENRDMGQDSATF